MYVDMKRLVYEVSPTLEQARDRLYQVYGEAPELGAMRKWVARRSAPGKWVLALMNLAECKNPDVYLISRAKRLSECQHLDLTYAQTAETNTVSESTNTLNDCLDLFG